MEQDFLSSVTVRDDGEKLETGVKVQEERPLSASSNNVYEEYLNGTLKWRPLSL